MDAGMPFQPGARLKAGMTREIISDVENVAGGIVGFDVGQQGDVAFGIARSRTAGHFFAITYPQRPIDPRFLGTASVMQLGFDAMPIRRPPRSGIKAARDYWSEFIGADGNGKIYRFPASYKGGHAIRFMRKIVL